MFVGFLKVGGFATTLSEALLVFVGFLKVGGFATALSEALLVFVGFLKVGGFATTLSEALVAIALLCSHGFAPVGVSCNKQRSKSKV